MPGGTNLNAFLRIFHAVTLSARRQTVKGPKAAVNLPRTEAEDTRPDNQ
jgi:hypothetical protein